VTEVSAHEARRDIKRPRIGTSALSVNPQRDFFVWREIANLWISHPGLEMHMSDPRSRNLGQVETYLRRKNINLPNLRLIGQSHYGSPGFAFIIVLGVDNDPCRRRAIRAEATELLHALGNDVHLEAGRDVYDVDPERPRSQHEELRFLSDFYSRMR
jgi:hypothetical protein